MSAIQARPAYELPEKDALYTPTDARLNFPFPGDVEPCSLDDVQDAVRNENAKFGHAVLHFDITAGGAPRVSGYKFQIRFLEVNGQYKPVRMIIGDSHYGATYDEVGRITEYIEYGPEGGEYVQHQQYVYAEDGSYRPIFLKPSPYGED